jgi:catechol 2,3-dioxygenase-like lactoylglutathione lyase family enzyme
VSRPSRADDRGRVVGIDHVQLAMPAGREADAVAFYTGGLGLTQVPKPTELAKRGGCWFDTGSVQIHLGVEADFRPAQKAHPGLIVDDLDSIAARLQAADHIVDVDTAVPGTRRAFVADPFGNRIELLQAGPVEEA